MKKLRMILCLALALLCAQAVGQKEAFAEAADAATPAPMPESITDRSIDDAYGDSASFKDPDRSVIYYQYAYNPAGHVDLLRYGFDGVTGTLENGSKVAVTNMQEKGYTYIQYGSTYGWVKNSDLTSKLPEGTEVKDQQNVSYRYLVGDYMAPVYLYANPGDSEDIGSLAAGVGILAAVHEWRDGYGYITFGGWKGWVKAKHLSGASDAGKADQTGQSASVSQAAARPEGGNASSTQGSAPAGGASVKAQETALVGADRETGEEIRIKYLGTAVCEDERGESVPAARLVFANDVPEERQLAVIFAPRTGHAALRNAPRESAKLLKNAKAGVIVAVLEVGNTYSKVNYKGTVGYVKNTSMRFFAAGSAQEAGMISFRGKTNGSTTVHVRCGADKNSWAVAEWETGTRVTVLSHVDGWYEIEAKGIHGYVQEQYLTK